MKKEKEERREGRQEGRKGTMNGESLRFSRDFQAFERKGKC